jgi:hypothetical protein
VVGARPGAGLITSSLPRKLLERCRRLGDRWLTFQPYIRTLEIDGRPIRFFYATAQAASLL